MYVCAVCVYVCVYNPKKYICYVYVCAVCVYVCVCIRVCVFCYNITNIFF